MELLDQFTFTDGAKLVERDGYEVWKRGYGAGKESNTQQFFEHDKFDQATVKSEASGNAIYIFIYIDSEIFHLLILTSDSCGSPFFITLVSLIDAADFLLV